MTTSEVAALSGASLRQLQWWKERGMVYPEQRGHAAQWDREEALMVLVILRLDRCGMSRAMVRKLLHRIRLITRPYLLVADNHIEAHETPGAVLGGLARTPRRWCFLDLKSMRASIDAWVGEDVAPSRETGTRVEMRA